MYRRKALYKKKKLPVVATKEKNPYFKVKQIKGEKNGGKRVVPLKKSVGYSAAPRSVIAIEYCFSAVATVLPHGGQLP